MADTRCEVLSREDQIVQFREATVLAATRARGRLVYLEKGNKLPVGEYYLV